MLCEPDEENVPATDRLLRDQFGSYRFEWSSDESVEFHLAHGEMIGLLHASGFEVEDLIEIQAPPGATTRHAYVTAEWARRGPAKRSGRQEADLAAAAGTAVRDGPGIANGGWCAARFGLLVLDSRASCRYCSGSCRSGHSEKQRGDRQNRDERQDQRVFRQALATR